MKAKNIFFATLLLPFLPLQAQESRMVKPDDIKPTSSLYVNNRAPLPAQPFLKLAPAAVTPRGWVGEMLTRQKNGLSGQLGEISDWLDKKGIYNMLGQRLDKAQKGVNIIDGRKVIKK